MTNRFVLQNQHTRVLFIIGIGTYSKYDKQNIIQTFFLNDLVLNYINILYISTKRVVVNRRNRN